MAQGNNNVGPAPQWWHDPANLLLLFGLLSGVALVFLLPPYQVADEWRHYFRVWQLAGGTLFGNGLGDDVPAELYRLTWETENFWGLPTREPLSWSAALDFLRRMAALRIDEQEMLYVHFPTVLYAPVPYLSMTVAVALGRLVTDSPLLLMYAGRLGGLLLALLLTWGAIRRAPFGKWAFFLMAMTPVVAFQRAGMSADGFINAAAMLHVALVLELAYVPGRLVRTADLFRLGTITVALCLCKQAYLILPLLHVVIPANRFRSARDCRVARYWLPAIGWALAVWWAVSVMRGNYEPMAAGCDAMGQLGWILGHPLQYLLVLFHDLVTHGNQYLHELIGTLGWLDLPTAPWLVGTHAVALLVVIALDDDRQAALSPFLRVWSALVLIASLGFVWTLMYLWWAPVGAAELQGMQGRYFAPFLPLLPLVIAGSCRPDGRALLRQAVFSGARPSVPWVMPRILGCYGAFLTIEMLWRVTGHHYQ